MFEFLERLFRKRKKDVTVLLFEGDEPETTHSYQFKPEQLWRLLFAGLAGVILLVLVLVMVTPLGELLYNPADARLRSEVIAVSKKVQALQDTLQLRDVQLGEMQRIIASGDSSFEVGEGYVRGGAPSDNRPELNLFSEVQAIPEVHDSEIIFSETFRNAPDFPASLPIEGTSTRDFNVEDGHFGIDVAVQEGTSFKAVADGVVINQEWTLNYGYVVHVQHNGGFVTIYKHAASLLRSIGDIVREGDFLGTAGDRGILSTGSHLHFELWKNGVPQNPNAYLIKS